MKVVVRMYQGGSGLPNVLLALEEPRHLTGVVGICQLSPPDAAILAGFAQEPATGEGVQQLGVELLKRLRDHPEVEKAIDSALMNGDPVPIYLRVGACDATDYPWECLFDTERGRFLALEPNWPIARITDHGEATKEERSFQPPLRLLAILSAVGVEAMEEWRCLHEVVSQASLDVELRVIAGEPAVHAAVEKTGDDRISGALLSDRLVLEREVKRFDPHIVHLFCHGSADPPELQLGAPRDHQAGQGYFIVDPLRMPVSRAAWLAVLNCCEGASPMPRAGTVAERLVGAGYPAAIGMRESIPSEDANLFTSYFYDELLRLLDTKLGADEEVELEWAAALRPPRVALRDKYTPALAADAAAAMYRDWTRPVLYVRPEPLRVRRVEVNRLLRRLPRRAATVAAEETERAKLAAKADQLARLRLNLAESTPPDVLREIDKEIEQVREQLGRWRLRRQAE